MKFQIVIMGIPFLVVLLTVFVDLTWGQLNLPEMPGPPYPDRWGNNRWGVKYDPRVHGRGSRPPHSQSSSASHSRPWDEQPQSHPPRYHGGNDHAQAPQPPTRSKWIPGLKPLVSSLASKYKSRSRHRTRPSVYQKDDTSSSYGAFDPTSDNFYNNPYTSKSIDRYVKNYLQHYNTVSKTPTSSTSDLVNIQSFAGEMDLSDKFTPKNFAMNGNRPSHYSSQINHSDDGTSVSYVRTARYTDSSNKSKARYRTLNPQSDFFGQSAMTKKSSTNTNGRNFAKTLSSIYNDYKPGAENTNSGSYVGSPSSSGSIGSASSDSFSNSIITTDEELNQYAPSISSSRPRGPPPRSPYRSSSSGRPRPSAVRTVSNVAGPGSRYYGSSSSKRPWGGSSSRYSSRPRPLSALDLYEESLGYSSSPGFRPHDIEYSGPSGVDSGSRGVSYSSAPGIDSSSLGYSSAPPGFGSNSVGYSSGHGISSSGVGYSSGPGIDGSSGSYLPGPGISSGSVSYSGGSPYSSYSSSHGPPPSSLVSSSPLSAYDSYGHAPEHYSPIAGPPPPPGLVGHNYIPPSNYYYSPPSYPPSKKV